MLCPACNAKNFTTDACCRRCGAELADFRGAPTTVKRDCPRCQKPLRTLDQGSVHLEECVACAGFWLDEATFKRLCEQKEQQSVYDAIHMSPTMGKTVAVETVRYVRCPLCQKLMNRVNYARTSGVIIDACKGHGIWFDQDELARILQFIKQGGLDKARQKEIDRLAQQKRELESKRREDAAHRAEEQNTSSSSSGVEVIGVIVDILAAIL